MKNSMSRVDALTLAIEALAGNEAAVSTLTNIRASIEKANAYKPDHKTPTKTQQENEILKADIVAFLSDGSHKTVSDIIKGMPALTGSSTQKVSALMRLLKLEGKVDKEMVKGKTLFFLV